MKVPPQNQNVTSASNQRADSPPSESSDSKKGAFSKLLDKKKQGSAEPGEDPFKQTPMQPGMPRMEQPLQQFGAQVSEAQPTATPPAIGALVNEMVQQIRVEAPPGQPPQVTIEFNSKTLDGLKVQIGQHEGKLVVHFETGSDKVSQLLSQNIGALNQNLTNQGYQVGVIDIRPPQRATFDRGRDSRSGDRGGSDSRGQSGGGGGRQR